MTTRPHPNRRRGVAAVLASLAVATVAAACGSAATGRPGPAVLTGTQAGSRSLALQDAEQLLASLPWSSAWPKPTGTAPPGFPSVLRGPAYLPLTPYLVDVTRDAVVPATPAGVLAWLQAHQPAGSSVAMHGESSTPGGLESVIGLSYPAETRLPQRSVLVEVTADGAKTAVRVDAQVVYRPDKPAGEVVPAGIVRAVLAVTPALGPTRTFVVTSPSQIAELVATVDALERPSATSNPGGPEISLNDARRQVTLDLYAAGSTRPAAVVVDRPAMAEFGTGNVALSVDGHQQPVLEDAAGNIAHLVTTLTGVRV